MNGDIRVDSASPRMDVTVESLVVSDRQAVEDAALVVRTEEVTAFVVADGAGGLGGGARASRLVVQCFEAAMADPVVAAITPDGWRDFLVRVDQCLLRDPDAGESTAVVGVIHRGRLVGASVGDSEAWVVGGGGCEVLTAGQHRKPRLGTGRAIPVGFEAFVTDAVILAATDGLFHAASAESIRAVLRTAPTAEALVALARSRSGRLYDDVGVVVCVVTQTLASGGVRG